MISKWNHKQLVTVFISLSLVVACQLNDKREKNQNSSIRIDKRGDSVDGNNSQALTESVQTKFVPAPAEKTLGKDKSLEPNKVTSVADDEKMPQVRKNGVKKEFKKLNQVNRPVMTHSPQFLGNNKGIGLGAGMRFRRSVGGQGLGTLSSGHGAPGSSPVKAKRGYGRKMPLGFSQMPYSHDYDRRQFPGDHEIANSGESYNKITDNPFFTADKDPLSTFSIDVDTASYSNIRRFIESGSAPPVDAVRIEELINYFAYRYPAPTDEKPFSTHVEIGPAPWKEGHRLVRIGLKGKDIKWNKRPNSNLVFLLDVSGSMNSPDKLPLLKKSMQMLVENLGERDRVAIVVYAGASGVVLESTLASESHKIMNSLDELQAGGSTNGGAGIQLAYGIAQRHFIKGGINRVILATDGDFNVGATSQAALIKLIKKKAKSGVFLTTLGFGTGNYKDSTMESLANKGNGNYAYIDSVKEARKVLVEEIGGTMMTIAKDVKIQVEFNPAMVQAYRLIGYENRILAHKDFNDDTKDAGEIGAGHSVTALYEVVPHGVKFSKTGVDSLKYQTPKATGKKYAGSNETLTLKLRYKKPEAKRSSLIEFAVSDTGKQLSETSADFQFAASVAAFGMILRNSPHKGKADLGMVKKLAMAGLSLDPHGYRGDFLQLIGQTRKFVQ